MWAPRIHVGRIAEFRTRPLAAIRFAAKATADCNAQRPFTRADFLVFAGGLATCGLNPPAP